MLSRGVVAVAKPLPAAFLLQNQQDVVRWMAQRCRGTLVSWHSCSANHLGALGEQPYAEDGTCSGR